MEETPGRASLEKLGCRTPPQLHAGGVGRQQQQQAVIVNKTTKVGKEQDLIQLKNTTNRVTAEAETEVQRRIENKQGKVNKVCTKYAYGQECKNGKTCKFIHKRICKIYVKYGQCRFGQRCNYSHDLEGRCKREEEHGWSVWEKVFLWTP